jgi:hypothetical protein
MPSLRTSLVLRRLQSDKDVFGCLGMMRERTYETDDLLDPDTRDLYPDKKSVMEIV